MPFGLVSRRELEQFRADLIKEIEESVAFKDELVMQWESWYAKFRSLYARLMKQAKKGEQEALEETNGEQTGVQLQQPTFRSRRGF